MKLLKPPLALKRLDIDLFDPISEEILVEWKVTVKGDP